jgi:hypothetical protein
MQLASRAPSVSHAESTPQGLQEVSADPRKARRARISAGNASPLVHNGVGVPHPQEQAVVAVQGVQLPSALVVRITGAALGLTCEAEAPVQRAHEGLPQQRAVAAVRPQLPPRAAPREQRQQWHVHAGRPPWGSRGRAGLSCSSCLNKHVGSAQDLLPRMTSIGTPRVVLMPASACAGGTDP